MFLELVIVKQLYNFDNKLGINITNPTRQLEIYNLSHATAALQSDNQSSLFFSDPSDTNIGQFVYAFCNYMYFRVNDAERFCVTSAGDVGIGEDSPADRLVVQEANPSGDVAVRIKNDTLPMVVHLLQLQHLFI